MQDVLPERVRAIQASMLTPAAEYFLEGDLEDLSVIIRLTVEFVDYLERSGRSQPAGVDPTSYICESVFSGIDSFASVRSAYSILPGARSSAIALRVDSVDSLREQFVSMYREFEDGADFTERCRQLLDLFKLQIVFAGLSY